MFYFSKLYYNEVKKGDDYKKAKRVVMVAILDYDLDLTKEIKRMETKWKLREENAKDLVLTDKIEIDIIELSKVRAEYEKNKQNKKAQWALFIDDPNTKEVEEIMKDNEDIEEAIVTSGGISIKEINPKTMESKIIKGLFFAGEIIDADAYTGGFNLQIAYSTGYTAGDDK